MLPIFPDCQFLIAPYVISHVYSIQIMKSKNIGIPRVHGSLYWVVIFPCCNILRLYQSNKDQNFESKQRASLWIVYYLFELNTEWH